MSKVKFTSIFYVRLFWILFCLPIITIILIFTLISLEKMGQMPSFEDLENPENNLASEVYSADSVLLGNYYFQYRSYVNFDDLSPYLVDALIATEDIRFHRHSGIDARGLARVLFKTILMGESAGGGSTITQQLSKNLFPRDTTSYNTSLMRTLNLGINKFKEWVTAVKLEKNYTKEEILVMYLNTVPFGGQSYGIKSAAKTFFNTSVDSLNIEQAALLVGLLKAPTRYSPVLNPEKSIERRNIVLGQMNKYHYINNEQYDSLRSIGIDLNYKVQDHNIGLATYLREYLRITLSKSKPERKWYYTYNQFKEDSVEWETNPIFGWCNKNIKPDGSNYNLYKDGLRIYTTINSSMQKYAEEAVEEHLSENLQVAFFEEKEGREHAPFDENLSEEEFENVIDISIRRTERYRRLRVAGKSMDSILINFNTPAQMKVFSWEGLIDTVMTPMDSMLYYKHFLRTGFISINPTNGHVKAYVGGPDFRHFKYDHVVQSKRQPGSTIKPFLYTLAMQEGYSPCYEVANVPITFEVNDSSWTPKNSGPSSRDGQMVPLKWGLANSVNYISAWLIKQFNPQSVINVMKKMGIESRIDAVPSIFLGTSDLSLYELTGAYTTFVNKGVFNKPIFITRIEDKNGNVLQEFTSEKTEAISKETAYLMSKLLEEVVRAGTGRRVRAVYKLMNEIGGKTGTTQNHSDGWFMGLTPKLVSGVWVGGEDRSIHFEGIRLGQGANMALPIWALYMQKVYNDSTLYVSPEDVFLKPEGFEINLDCGDSAEEQETHYESDEFF